MGAGVSSEHFPRTTRLAALCLQVGAPRRHYLLVSVPVKFGAPRQGGGGVGQDPCSLRSDSTPVPTRGAPLRSLLGRTERVETPEVLEDPNNDVGT